MFLFTTDIADNIDSQKGQQGRRSKFSGEEARTFHRNITR